jgi:hypothetical protein
MKAKFLGLVACVVFGVLVWTYFAARNHNSAPPRIAAITNASSNIVTEQPKSGLAIVTIPNSVPSESSLRGLERKAAHYSETISSDGTITNSRSVPAAESLYEATKTTFQQMPVVTKDL